MLQTNHKISTNWLRVPCPQLEELVEQISKHHDDYLTEFREA